ncbi:MAG: biotin/lipoyl-binding protein [Acidimicrobiales bacterium]|nr:biotin/lipoyl-binding protein [Acidimicrobiales bacterium]
MNPAPLPSYTSVLVANRGEIARRVIRTARELGLGTVAVYSDADRDAAHVRDADAAVRLGPAPAGASYLDVDRILAAARASGAQAVHPGYGFLSERADVARAVVDAGLVWIGPPADAIAAMGDKVAAKAEARAAGVPVLPEAVLDGDDPTGWREAAEPVGYPLLVKAAAGGGGRGMRLVTRPEDLPEAVAAARREAQAAFGDGTVFAERFVRSGRHVEIQVVADRHGAVVHLGERDCSVQRRHQKIVEEAPSPAVTPDLRRRLGSAAVELARRIGYEGVGTVELLLEGTGDDARFWFLEMNTRLQVEHPVTEAVWRVDLVRLQLAVAAGEPLGFDQDDLAAQGHAVEARIYAEDPTRDWLPSTGALLRWRPGPTPARWDSGVEEGDEVSPHYDPMLAKAIAHAGTREEAAARLARALDELEVHGVRTNRDLLTAVLREPSFLAGEATTAFLDDATHLRASGPDGATTARHAVAATLAGVLDRRGEDALSGFAPPGWRNVAGDAPHTTWHDPNGATEPTTVRYRLEARGGFRAVVEPSGVELHGRVAGTHRTGPTRHLELEVHDGDDAVGVATRLRCTCTTDPATGATWVSSHGATTAWQEAPRFTEHGAAGAGGGPLAPVPGRVVRVATQVGDHVEAGQTLVVLEAMKVEHRIAAAEPGTVVAVLVAEGDTVEAHQLLVRLEEGAP